MPPRKEDRRVQRTRRLLREALMALVLERGYEPLTVQDILDRANLGRSTFYAHFRSKDELLWSGFQQFLQAFEQHARAAPPGRGSLAAFSLALFRHVAEVRLLLKALLGRHGSPDLAAKVEETLRRTLHHQLAALAPASPPAPARPSAAARAAPAAAPTAPPVPLDLAAHFLASSLLAFITHSLERDLPHTPEELDAIWKRLALPGLTSALGLRQPLT